MYAGDVGGLDPRLTEGDVAIVFSQWGEPIDVVLIRDQKTGKPFSAAAAVASCCYSRLLPSAVAATALCCYWCRFLLLLLLLLYLLA